MQVTLPGLLDYNGPIPDELGRVSLPPNFDCMTPDEQQKGKEATSSPNLAQSLFGSVTPE